MSLLGFIMDHRVTYRGEVALLTRVWVLLSISGHPREAFHQQGSGFLAGIKAGHLRQVVASSWVLGWGAHNRPSTKECVVVWIKMVYTSQAVGGRFLSLRPVWSTEWVPGQPRLYRKTLSQKNIYRGWWDGSVGKSTQLLFLRSGIQITATTWWLTTIHNEIWLPLLECLRTATVYSHVINKINL